MTIGRIGSTPPIINPIPTGGGITRGKVAIVAALLFAALAAITAIVYYFTKSQPTPQKQEEKKESEVSIKTRSPLLSPQEVCLMLLQNPEKTSRIFRRNLTTFLSTFQYSKQQIDDFIKEWDEEKFGALIDQVRSDHSLRAVMIAKFKASKPKSKPL